MCGICGIINFNNKIVLEDELLIMMKSMRNRGPDDLGVNITQNFGQGFVRLSIIDLSNAGHQPMLSEDNNYSIVFNGEVYNYLELKGELSYKYNFKSKTDTEVVLYAYIEWGVSCLDKLNGMFAFTIYDKSRNKLFGARDRYGIKPFYYYKTNDTFIYASDIPPILKGLKNKPIQDDSAIFNFLLTNRTNYSEDTFFKDIKKLQHGHYFIIENNQFYIKKWYSLADQKGVEGFTNSEEYFGLLQDSIKLQLRSDVPIGVCLSGGLDSSSVLTILFKDFGLKDIHTFSAIYNKGDVGDEQEFIKSFSNDLKNMHFTNPTSSGLFDDLKKVIIALSEPVPNTSEYAEFKVMELAKDYCTVILNGQGADEVLGGYSYFYGALLYDFIINKKAGAFVKEIIAYYKLRHNFDIIKHFIFYLLPNQIKSNQLFNLNKTINNDFYNKYSKTKESNILKFYNFKTLKEFYLNHFEYKFEHNLLWADKSGMYFSLETRFPFLDHRLIERTLATSDSKILSGGWTKLILREAMKGRLYENIRLRTDKVGFGTPEDEWFRQHTFIDLFKDILYSKSFNERYYFNSKSVITMFQEHLSRKANYGSELWKVIHLELWLREFID